MVEPTFSLCAKASLMPSKKQLVVLLAVILALGGCNTPAGYEVRGGSLCKLGVDGRCYHIGDQWTMHRLDKNYRPYPVR